MSSPSYLIGLAWENLRVLGFADIDTTFVAVGTPFEHPLRCLQIYNSTNEDMIVSDDGVNDKDIIPAGIARILDIATNASSQAGILSLATGKSLYVRGETEAPTSGSVYITAIYAA